MAQIYGKAMAKGFDPRPHARGDKEAALVVHNTKRFRSTPPREGRPGDRCGARRLRNCFDPRPHARGDSQRRGNQVRNPIVSIHAPTRGATATVRPRPMTSRSFDPRPHARGDTVSHWRTRLRMSFDPRPHARGDTKTTKTTEGLPWFRSTPPREGRQG